MNVMNKTTQRLLITGFDPFGGETVNPSFEAVKRLPDRIGAYVLEKLEIPTVYGTAAERVLERARECAPDVVLCIGQAGGREAITPEVIGINLREGSIADNSGVLHTGEPIFADAPDAYFSTLPVRKMVDAVRRAGLSARLSYSAGAFVCNDTLYTLLHHYHGTSVRVGFIHVPFLPEQAKGEKPSMPLDDIVKALEAAILGMQD